MKIKALGNLYPMPTRPLTLGEQRLIKREFGVVLSDELDLADPDQLAAFLYAAMRQNDPDVSAKTLLAAIDRIRSIEIVDDDGNPLPDEPDEDADEAVEENPTPPATPAESSGSEPESSETGE